MALVLKNFYSYADFMDAYLDCRRRKRKSPQQLKFEVRLEDNLQKLMDEVNSETYAIGTSRAFTVLKPKPREIWAAQFRDRVVHHLLYNDMGAYFERRFIEDTFSCIPGRGTLAACQRAQTFMRRATENYARTAYFLQVDIKNFFVSINRQTLWQIVVAHTGTDSLGARLLRKVILHDPTSNAVIKEGSDFSKIPPHKSLWKARKGYGLPIGNLTSQFLSNVYLNAFDHYVKHQLKVKHYIRYVDDALFISRNKDKLSDWLGLCDAWLKANRELMFHPDKSLIAPIAQGIDFVGQIIKPWRTYPRRRVVHSAREAVLAGNDNALQSYLGIFRHLNTHNLCEKLLGEVSPA